MAKSKRTGKAHVNGYAKYKNSKTEITNRVRKLKALLIEQPNNEQIKLAINNVAHRRNPPKTRMWSATTIKLASIMKRFTGKFNREVFSNDIEISSAAYKNRNENKFKNYVVPKSNKSMFSLGERAVWKS